MIYLLYITVRDKEEARTIAGKLMDDRLIACANIVCGVESLYRWKGENRDSSEVLLLAKTTEAELPAAIEAARAMHSYELPCIVAFPIAAGLPAFLEWAAGEVKK